MILKELVNCYELMKNSDKFTVPDFPLSIGKISYKFIISQDGLIKQILDIRENKKGIFALVPFQPVRTSGASAYFLCDNSKYLLGCSKEKNKEVFKECLKEFELSKKFHLEILNNISESKYFSAINNFFLKRDENIKIAKELDSECLVDSFISFVLEDDNEFIHNIPEIKDTFINYINKDVVVEENNQTYTCLISGEKINKVCDKYMTIKLSGGQPAGCYICFGNISDSYNKTINLSFDSMFKYTTALSTLLLSKNNNTYLSGNSVVYWSDDIESKSSEFIASFMQDDYEDTSNEENAEYNQQGVDEIKEALHAIKIGAPFNIDKLNLNDSNIYILGLSPNNTRIFIRFWYKNTFKNFLELSNKHFEDTKLRKKIKTGKTSYKYEDLGVKFYTIIKNIRANNKSENTPKTLINTLFKSILNGGIYPISIYNNILIRIRAEINQNIAINHARVAYIKGYLKRFYRVNNLKNKEEELTVSLNNNSENTSYNLGRIFALLEKIQSDANGNSNIRERYFSAASSTPAAIFPTLLNLAQYHISKIKKENNKNFNFQDKLIESILSKINEFPSILNIEEQGMFILGYYHQREDIYTPKENKQNQENKEDN